MLSRKVRRDIAWGYWTLIALALWVLIWDSFFDEDMKIETPSYVIALGFVIHAHGNRIRETLLALHAPKEDEDA